MQALEAVEKAVACNPDNAEMKRKARDLRKLAGGGVSRAKADKENQVSSNHADAPQPQTPSLEERPPLKVKPPGCAAGSIVCCFAREYALASRNFTCCMHSLHHSCCAGIKRHSRRPGHCLTEWPSCHQVCIVGVPL